jgi:hypothetical protein
LPYSAYPMVKREPTINMSSNTGTAVRTQTSLIQSYEDRLSPPKCRSHG